MKPNCNLKVENRNTQAVSVAKDAWVNNKNTFDTLQTVVNVYGFFVSQANAFHVRVRMRQS